MRVSRLMLVTLRDVPADAEITSHQLLLRGGYIRRIAAGVYAYMPMMWRVLNKITSIVQTRMDGSGALQTLLPQLHPAELWERSGRWKGYTAGEGIMFNLTDRQNRNFGLGPTHEEVITTIISELLHSYKQLPVNLYQIQTKFRDEIRPRFGLMRSREFIMKDAYSFHSQEIDLKDTYERMNKTYKEIFADCGINTVAVYADSGAIGGGASQEFMVTADSGEDLILTSSDGLYAANQEKAESRPPKANPLDKAEVIELETPDQITIESLCSTQEIHPSQIVKVILMLALNEDETTQPLLIAIRGDQEVNETKLMNMATKESGKTILDIVQITPDKLKSQGLEQWPFGAIGPDLKDKLLHNAKSWEKSFLRLVDNSAADLDYFVCGANKKDTHRKFVTWDLLDVSPIKVDIRKAKAGDHCIHDPKQYLKECRGIEVGHIFQLGQKYSKALNATFTNEEGKQEPFWMGCYGIGISRLAQAAIEQNNDKEGICWPISIAPFEVIIVIANMQDINQQTLGEKIYRELKSLGIDVLIDDRNERAGVKFKDADLIGIPWRLVVGREASSQQVELMERSTKKCKILGADIAIKKLIKEICQSKTYLRTESL